MIVLIKHTLLHQKMKIFVKYRLLKNTTRTIENVTLPKPVGFTGPIKVELHNTDGKLEQVSYNHYFDLKGDNHINF